MGRDPSNNGEFGRCRGTWGGNYVAFEGGRGRSEGGQKRRGEREILGFMHSVHDSKIGRHRILTVLTSESSSYFVLLAKMASRSVGRANEVIEASPW